tara:strand:+ start:5960 stop:6145 length:186 start_codon:yes stop_codon:yes gene_type:complete
MSGVYDKEIWGDEFLVVPTILRKKAHRAYLNRDFELLNSIKAEVYKLFFELKYNHIKTEAN